MILRRLAHSLRRQDWMAVFLEFLILVVGVYVGLQVDAWNDGRKDRLREATHLEQLSADLLANAEELSAYAETHRELEQDLMFAIGALQQESLDEQEYERFKWAVLRMNQYPPPVLFTGAYDTMIASGELPVLTDPTLKTDLVRLHSYFANLPARMTTLVGAGQREFELRHALSVEAHPSGRGLQFNVSHAALRDDPQALEILSRSRRNHGIVADTLSDLATESERLQAATAGASD